MLNPIIIIFLIGIIIAYVLCNTNNEPFHEDIRGRDIRNKLKRKYLLDEYELDLEEKDEFKNNEFVEAQFHNDYRDTITAFNNIAPSQKQIFNIENQPVKFYNPPLSEVKKLIDDFIYQVNKNVINDVPDYRVLNTGWDEPLPDPTYEGWAKNMKNLGLPDNLYPDPAKKAKITLLKVDHIEKYETDKEIRYTVHMFIKKENVKDILIIRVSFVLDKRLMDENKILLNNKIVEMNIVLEEIFIVGFMTERGVGRDNLLRDTFYNFNDLQKDGITDDAKIISQLNQKLKDRQRETNRFNNNMGDEFRALKLNAPTLENYDSYKATQTIYDDYLRPRTYS